MQEIKQILFLYETRLWPIDVSVLHYKWYAKRHFRSLRSVGRRDPLSTARDLQTRYFALIKRTTVKANIRLCFHFMRFV